MAAHSHILAWRIPWTEQLQSHGWSRRATVHGVAESDKTEHACAHTEMTRHRKAKVSRGRK